MPRYSEIDRAQMKLLGDKIKYLREKKGFTRTDLAYACKLQPQSIHDYELGRSFPMAIYLHRIAKTLNVSMDEFF